MRKHMFGAAAVLVLGLSLSACAGGDADQKSDQKAANGSSSASGNDMQLKWAKCMRDNGADVPDPTPGEPGLALDASDPKVKAAAGKCKQYSPNGGESKDLDPAALDQLVKYAKCMRDNGVDMPDPKADGSLTVAQGDNPAAMEKALKACKEFQPGAGR